jgi:hypothetical protein
MANTFHLFWIGVAATTAIIWQSSVVMLAFGWASTHGVGVHALAAILPTAIALTLLWAGWLFATTQGGRRRSTVLFAVYAFGIFVVNEAALPQTPLREWKFRAALDGVRVLAVRDEVALSARGNPIGVRIAADVVFPRSLAGFVNHSTLGPIGDPLPIPLHLSNGREREIHPLPARLDTYELYQEEVVYTVTSTILPSFIEYDWKTGEPCRSSRFSEDAVLSALAANKKVTVRGEIHVVYEHHRIVAKEYVLSADVDLEAIYRTILLEGHKTCGGVPPESLILDIS